MSYCDFFKIFGVKKHELDRSQLKMFVSKYLQLLHLHMPTMNVNRGDDEDSNYEEEILIAQKKLVTLANARKVVQASRIAFPVTI